MNALSDRRDTLIGAGVLVVAALLVGLLFMSGSQVSKILSTVGNAVQNPEPGNGSDSTGQGSGGAGSDQGSGSGSGSANGGQVADAAAAVPTLLIVRTGELTLQVPDLDAALRDGGVAVIRAGGYVSGSSRTTDGGHESAQVTYRIPSAAWNATLAVLHGVGSTTVSEKVKTEEVTGQVVDLTAHIANLRATEAALQAIMARATKISDVLDVQEQLTTTRGEIEKLVADKAHLVDHASYGSLAVTYRLPVAPIPSVTPTPPKGWDPGDDVARASGKLVKIGQATTSVGIWLAIVGLPVAIGGAILALLAWQVTRFGRWLIRRRETAIEPAI
jgi:hypothetical protein